MKEEIKKATIDTNKIVSAVAHRIETLSEEGLVLPDDFNYNNALKSAMFTLLETKDKNGKNALETCTQVSIQACLFDMCVKGLDMSKKQCYPIVYGNKLSLMESYFGKILKAKRISPSFDGRQAKVVREGDVFETEIINGYRKVTKHIEDIKNMDKPILCAYAIINNKDGNCDTHLMSMVQIQAAWNKSQARDRKFQKEFPEKAALRTVISSGINILINSTPGEFDKISTVDVDYVDVTKEDRKVKEEYADFEEVEKNPPIKKKESVKVEAKSDEPF